MMDDTPETSSSTKKFDASAFPEDTLFHERRLGADRRDRSAAEPEPDAPVPRVAKERRARKERRRRIDPTTFEKQYTEDELEFMNAMQRFKVQACKSFPTHGEVLRVALALGYRKVTPTVPAEETDADEDGLAALVEEPAEALDLSIAAADQSAR